MLLAEYDYETDIAVQRAEEREIAFAERMSKGISQGIFQGIERGIEQGAYQNKLETAAAFKRLGIDSAQIAERTGLTISQVETLN